MAMQLRDLHDHGWYWQNDDLGFPFGQNGSLFPELNVLHMALVKVLGLFFGDPYTPGVVYFVAGFPLAAAAMFALARSQGIARSAAMVVGILFAAAPGHQERFGQLWLAAYWTVPLGIWLVLRIMGSTRKMAVKSPGQRVVDRDAALMGLAAVTVGLSGVYYVAFTLILLVLATVVRRLSGAAKDWLPGIAVMGLVTVTALVPLVVARVGSRSSAMTGAPATMRSPAESELFAGKAMDLLLPWEGHRIEFLSYLTSAYKAVQPSTVETAALGVVSVAGCVVLLVVAFQALATLRLPPTQVRRWVLLAGASFAFYTIGGLGSFVAIFFTPQVRTWSRLSLYILLFALLAVGWGLTRLLRNARPYVGVLVCLAVLMVGVLDQTNSSRAPDHHRLAAELQEARTYASSIQGAVGEECGVFQLPVVSFPESAGTPRMNGYDQLIPYLASRGLKWSSGAMRGTSDSEWQLAADLNDVDKWTSDLRAAGFCAVEVNLNGFAEGRDPRWALEAELGSPVAQGADGALLAYRLPESPAFNRNILDAVVVSLAAHEIRVVEGIPQQWVGPRATIRAVNLSSRNARVTLTMRYRSLGEGPRQVALTGEHGQILESFTTHDAEERTLRFAMLARPGTSEVELRLSGEPTQLRDSRRSVFGEVSALEVEGPSDMRVVSLQSQVAAGVVVP
ncbi:hypothetical protein [Intrasporangium sp. DVR]|uniref:hypothetical protein n=1 Tax=Intrasporangium sp. DVR TaxID=3127867 RepID=UPI0033420DB4